MPTGTAPPIYRIWSKMVKLDHFKRESYKPARYSNNTGVMESENPSSILLRVPSWVNDLYDLSSQEAYEYGDPQINGT